MINNWILQPTLTKGLDLLLLLLAFSFFLFALGSFIKWLKPQKSHVGKDGVTFEFGGKGKDSKEGSEIDLDKKEMDSNLSEEEKKVSLSSCIEETPSFGNELYLVISKSIRFGYEICKVKEFYLIRAQMNMAQVKTDTIKNILLKDYTNKIFSMQLDNINSSEFSFEIFQEFMSKIIKNKVLDDLKQAFKEKHLMSYSEESYEEVYCRDHIKRILTNLRIDIINTLPDNIIPPISNVVETFDKYEQAFYGILKEIFFEARALAFRHEADYKKKTLEFDTEIMNITGLENASRSSK